MCQSGLPKNLEFLRDETRVSSRSKARFTCIPEYQTVWCSQLKAREDDHFEWSLPERLRELSKEALGYVSQDIANTMLKWTPMEILFGELMVDEEANVLVVSGPVGRDAEQLFPKALTSARLYML